MRWSAHWPAWAIEGYQIIRKDPWPLLTLGAGTVLLAFVSSSLDTTLTAEIGKPAFYPKFRDWSELLGLQRL